MLSPALENLKNVLIEKDQDRTKAQNELLRELDALDLDIDFKNIIDKETFPKHQITSGVGECPCCGYEHHFKLLPQIRLAKKGRIS